jgi:hypothetical protein
VPPRRGWSAAAGGGYRFQHASQHLAASGPPPPPPDDRFTSLPTLWCASGGCCALLHRLSEDSGRLDAPGSGSAVALGGPVADCHLLFLHLPIHPRELSVVLAVVVFVQLAWTTRDDQEPLLVAAYLAAVRAVVLPHLVNIFM